MAGSRRMIGSEYMLWAKTRSQSRFNLATSGVLHYPIEELGADLADIELSGPSFYGYPPLQAALAVKCGVSAECVVSAIGTSLANHLAMAAVIEPGDEVLIEHPVYEPITALARYLGAEIRFFSRRLEDGFRVDPAEVERKVTGRTRLIVITNLHNPSSALCDTAALERVGEIARSVDARVLVDEVYIEAVAVQSRGRTDVECQSAFRLGNEFIATASLTKAYGLSGLRCGWVLAEPELAQRMWRLNDLFEVIPAHPAERLSVVALEHLDQISVRAAALLERNRMLLNAFLDSRDDLEMMRPEFGTVVFPRLRAGNADRLCALLREKYETTVVPGSFFDMPDHFRLGLGGPTETLAEGLQRLASALDALR